MAETDCDSLADGLAEIEGDDTYDGSCYRDNIDVEEIN